MTPRVWYVMRVLTGVSLCAAAALAVSASQVLHPWRVILPLAFVVVLVLVAVRYGVLVAVIGAPLSALIFAHFLYPPFDSVHVDDAAAKGNLGWMVLAGVVISYLIVPQRPGMPHK